MTDVTDTWRADLVLARAEAEGELVEAEAALPAVEADLAKARRELLRHGNAAELILAGGEDVPAQDMAPPLRQCLAELENGIRPLHVRVEGLRNTIALARRTIAEHDAALHQLDQLDTALNPPVAPVPAVA